MTRDELIKFFDDWSADAWETSQTFKTEGQSGLANYYAGRSIAYQHAADTLRAAFDKPPRTHIRQCWDAENERWTDPVEVVTATDEPAS